MDHHMNKNIFPNLSKEAIYPKHKRNQYIDQLTSHPPSTLFDIRYLPKDNTIEEQVEARKRHIDLFNNQEYKEMRRMKDYAVAIPSIHEDTSASNPTVSSPTFATKFLFGDKNAKPSIPSSCLFPPRKVLLPDARYHQLVDLIHGDVYGPPERPDLETFLIGVGAKQPSETSSVDSSGRYIVQDESCGKGLEVIFDPIKQVFVLCEEIIDKLVLLAFNDMEKAMEVSRCITRFGVYEIDYVDEAKQRLLESLINREIKPLLHDETFIQGLIMRNLKRKGVSITATRRNSLASVKTHTSIRRSSDATV
jgi:hypothetical protein